MNVNNKINYKTCLPFSLPFFISVFKSKLVKCRDEDYDNLPLPLDALEGTELSDILNNPNFQGDPDQLMEETMYNSVFPPQFAYLHSQFKTSLEHDTWKGFRIGFSWHPNMTFNSELQLTLDRIRGYSLNNYVFSVTTVLPKDNNPNKGAVLLARSEGGQKLMIQTHGDVTNKDKVIMAGHYMTKDSNQGVFEVEYNRKMDRLQLDIKMSQMGYSLSAVTALTKGIFLGFEGMYSTQNKQIMYSYGAKSNLPIKNLSCAFTYIGYMPYLMVDFMYKVFAYLIKYNNNMSFYANYSNNEMMGKKEYKGICKYRQKDYELMAGIINFNNLNGYFNYKINKYFSVQGNLEFSPLSFINRKGKGSSGKIGFGLHINSPTQDELIQSPEKEDFSNFNYDTYLDSK